MSTPAYRQLLDFLSELETRKIAYSLDHIRDEAVMVSVAVPGERWEIEFLDDGSVDIERFVSTGTLCDQRALADLFARSGE